MLDADSALTFMGLLHRREDVISGGGSEDDAELSEADRRALSGAAEWRVTQTTNYARGTAEYSDAVDRGILELDELQARDAAQRQKRHEAAEARRSKLEPRVPPS
jgi:hypothetical protein